MSSNTGIVSTVGDGIRLFFTSYFHTIIFVLPLIVGFVIMQAFPQLFFEDASSGSIAAANGAADTEQKLTGVGTLLSSTLSLLKIVVTIWVVNTLKNELTGQTVSFESANQHMSRSFFNIIGFGLLILLVGAVIALAIGGPIYLFTQVGSPSSDGTVGSIAEGVSGKMAGISASLGVLGLVGLLLVVYFMIRFYFVYLAIIVEGKGPIEAIKRSFQLTKGKFFKTFGIIILTALLVMAVAILIGIIAGVLGLLLPRMVDSIMGIFTIVIAYGTFALYPAIGVVYHHKLTSQSSVVEENTEA